MKLSFLAPNEEPGAKMTELQVSFPTPPQTPIPTVTVEAKPGWTVTVTTTKLAKPIVTDDGNINDVVSEIDWKAKTARRRRSRPDQFGEFTIDADGLPDNENQVVFKAIQTYSNGDVVRWIDPVTPGGPDGRAPHADPRAHQPGRRSATPTTDARRRRRTTVVAATSTKDNSARALAIIAIVLGAVALLLATGALMRKRRKA